MADPKPETTSASAIDEIWPRITALLDQMLALPPEQRRAWLEDLEGVDPETARHLESCVDEIELLQSDAFLTGDSPASPFATTLAGQRIGAYTLERCLGHGGMGAVWLARRDDGRFEGRVAVKLLNAALIGHPTEQRFVREGTLLARLQHPNIAHLVDAGIAAGSQPYLVLEYVEGERIDRYCELHSSTVEQRLALFVSVLDAVSHAHRNLIVHRDLKPANILVTSDGRAKLLDFGVAALLEADEQNSELTRQAPPGLTIAYAAPEQLQSGAVTTATDVYALGLILYLLLADRPPFETDDKTATEVMQAVLETDPPPPSKVATRAATRRLLAGDLDNIIGKALRKDPVERYASVDAFAQDVRRYLAHEPVAARPDSLGYRASKFVRRHRGGVAAAVLVLLSLVGTAIVTSVLMADARKQRDHAQFESRRAEMVSDFMGALLMSDGGPDRPALKASERLERGVELLEKQYQADPRFLGLMLIQLAHQYRGVVEVRRADELYQRAYEMGQRIDDDELMASAQCNHAYADGLSGIDQGTAGRIAEANRLMQRLDAPPATVRATCLLASAQLEISASRPQAAESLLREALRAIEAEGSEHRPIYVKALTDLGGLYLSNNQPAKALQMAELAGEVHERNGRGDTSARLVSRQNAAIALSGMGETRRALEQYEIVLRRTRELEPEGHEPTYYAVNYGSMLVSMRRPQEALAAIGPALQRARTTGSPKSLVQALRNYAAALVGVGRFDEAAAAADEAAQIAAKMDRNNQALIENCKTEIALGRGDLAAAAISSKAALKSAGYGSDHAERQLNRALLLATSVALRSGALTDAEEYGKTALSRTEALARGPDTSADVGEALLLLAKVRITQGSASAAKPLLERAVRCFESALTTEHPLAVEARQLLAA
ncbi:MAG TPA: serine/threonine-protein kinase [Steroidobacteraceae bacterium]|nr:serine/threonine-protein kinase [Steroidobacteraceae bacterium]